jgi:DnaJ-class molecular chaperone
MTPATATAWVTDRLSQAWREGSASSGGPGDDLMRRRLAGHPARPVGGGRLTLEQRLDGVWEGLRADGVAECPACHGRMEGPGPARCRDCGSELA